MTMTDPLALSGNTDEAELNAAIDSLKDSTFRATFTPDAIVVSVDDSGDRPITGTPDLKFAPPIALLTDNDISLISMALRHCLDFWGDYDVSEKPESPLLSSIWVTGRDINNILSKQSAITAILTGDFSGVAGVDVNHLRDRMDTYRTLAEERDDTIAQLRTELTALAAQRDELLTMVDEKNSEIARLNCEVAALWQRIDNGNESEEAKDSIITELRSQIDKLTTAALEPQPPANIEAIMAMINQQHQIIARLDQHLAIALGMADYRAALGQLG